MCVKISDCRLIFSVCLSPYLQVYMGSCASILCSKLYGTKGIATVNDSGCVPDDKAPEMNALCLASTIDSI